MNSNKIVISVGNQKISATVRKTPTANAILETLPFTSTAQTWGEEVYFSAPVKCTLESDAKSVVDAGEIAFWVEGCCIAIGYGPTPISHADEIRLAAKTNIWADATNDVRVLKNTKPGDPIHIDWATS